MNLKEDYHQKLQAQLGEWKTELDKLKVKADKTEASVKLEYYKQIDSLREKQEVAKQKLAGLKHASENSWEDLKTGVDGAWKELGEALKSISSRFK